MCIDPERPERVICERKEGEGSIWSSADPQPPPGAEKGSAARNSACCSSPRSNTASFGSGVMIPSQTQTRRREHPSSMVAKRAVGAPQRSGDARVPRASPPDSARAPSEAPAGDNLQRATTPLSEEGAAKRVYTTQLATLHHRSHGSFLFCTFILELRPHQFITLRFVFTSAS